MPRQVVAAFQGVLPRIMALSAVTIFLMQATRATFLCLPVATSHGSGRKASLRHSTESSAEFGCQTHGVSSVSRRTYTNATVLPRANFG